MPLNAKQKAEALEHLTTALAYLEAVKTQPGIPMGYEALSILIQRARQALLDISKDWNFEVIGGRV